MGQPIECGAGQALAAKDFGPVLERQVGRDDQIQPFVGGADHVEQQLCTDLAWPKAATISSPSRSPEGN